MTDVPVLEINVSKKLGDFAVDVRLSSDGGVMALFGRSGAGKSSIVKMIAGLLTPDAGVIKIFGETIYDSSSGINIKPENRSIGYVFQEDLLFPHMNVTSNLRYGIKRNPTNKQEIIFDDVVGILGLENILERMPHNLSGGERQRVSIGRALISNPKLLLMDEPLTSLDLVRKSEILPYIERLSGEFGIPVVYVSHSLEEVVRLADTIALISDGKSVAKGGLAEIMSRLDLAPLTGRHDAGAVLEAVVINPTSADGLSSLDVCGYTLWVPEIDMQSGEHVRMRVRARDVVLAKTLPEGTSILNSLAGNIIDIKSGDGPHTEVAIEITPVSSEIAPQVLIARITRRSASRMELKKGNKIYALVKAVAIDCRSLGGRGHNDRK